MSVVTEEIQKVINNGSTITFPPSVKVIDIPEEASHKLCVDFYI